MKCKNMMLFMSFLELDKLQSPYAFIFLWKSSKKKKIMGLDQHVSDYVMTIILWLNYVSDFICKTKRFIKKLVMSS